MSVTKLVTTEEFWQLMCDGNFYRISRLSGQVRGVTYATYEAPEDKPGFIEGRIKAVKAAIGIPLRVYGYGEDREQ